MKMNWFIYCACIIYQNINNVWTKIGQDIDGEAVDDAQLAERHHRENADNDNHHRQFDEGKTISLPVTYSVDH